jgi:hypothetical protein
VRKTPPSPTTNRILSYVLPASAEARIESFDQKPESGKIPARARPPINIAR